MQGLFSYAIPWAARGREQLRLLSSLNSVEPLDGLGGVDPGAVLARKIRKRGAEALRVAA